MDKPQWEHWLRGHFTKWQKHLHPDEILPYLVNVVSTHCIEGIQCDLRNDGRQRANFAMLREVQRFGGPAIIAFLRAVESLETYQELLEEGKYDPAPTKCLIRITSSWENSRRGVFDLKQDQTVQVCKDVYRDIPKDLLREVRENRRPSAASARNGVPASASDASSTSTTNTTNISCTFANIQIGNSNTLNNSQVPLGGAEDELLKKKTPVLDENNDDEGDDDHEYMNDLDNCSLVESNQDNEGVGEEVNIALHDHVSVEEQSERNIIEQGSPLHDHDITQNLADPAKNQTYVKEVIAPQSGGPASNIRNDHVVLEPQQPWQSQSQTKLTSDISEQSRGFQDEAETIGASGGELVQREDQPLVSFQAGPSSVENAGGLSMSQEDHLATRSSVSGTAHSNYFHDHQSQNNPADVPFIPATVPSGLSSFTSSNEGSINQTNIPTVVPDALSLSSEVNQSATALSVPTDDDFCVQGSSSLLSSAGRNAPIIESSGGASTVTDGNKANDTDLSFHMEFGESGEGADNFAVKSNSIDCEPDDASLNVDSASSTTTELQRGIIIFSIVGVVALIVSILYRYK